MQLVVSNLPLPCSAAEVRELFAAYGTVTDAYISPVVASFAFIEMSSQSAANTAWQELHHSNYRGNIIIVVPPRPNPPGPTLSLSGAPEPQTNISITLTEPISLSNIEYVEESTESQPQGMVLAISNLPSNHDKQEIRKLFKEYGAVESVKLFNTVEDKAVVEMTVREEALSAIEGIDGSSYNGNILSVATI